MKYTAHTPKGGSVAHTTRQTESAETTPENPAAPSADVPCPVPRYFGHATFEEYYQSLAARIAHLPAYLRPSNADEVMSAMLKKVAGGVWQSVIEFISRELITNPRYRTDPVWYFVIPECRALIPADALAVADCCGAGIPLPNARPEGHLPIPNPESQ
jgi:hypothetical protein